MGIFENSPLNSWQPDGGTVIPISVMTITEEFENRLIERERVGRPGAKIDSTGPKKRVFTVELLVQNGIEEPGIPKDNYYPEVLNDLLGSIDVSGTLTLSTRGPIRARCKNARRVEKSDERDCAAVSMTFWEDNEDAVTATSFAKLSPHVAAPQTHAAFTVEASAVGLMSLDVLSLADLVDQLVTAINTLGRVVDIGLVAVEILAATSAVEGAFANRTSRVGVAFSRILSDPEGWRAARLLRRLAAQAYAAALLQGSPTQQDPTQIVSYRQDVSLFDLAGTLHQDLETLLQLNANYENPFVIPAGSPIRIVQV